MTTATKLNNKQTAIAFGITQMTLRNWRAGTAKRAPIPHAEDRTSGKIVYSADKLQKWATKHSVTVVVPFDKAVADSAGTEVKPGPKTPAAPSAKNKTVVAAKKAVQKALSPALKKAKARLADKKAPAAKPVKAPAVVAKQPETAQAA